MTKIVFMGTPAFSVPILEGLLTAGYSIQAVVTQPDRLVGRKRILTPPPVKEAALKHDLLVLQPEKLSGSKEMTQLIEMQPDIIITAAYGQFLPNRLLHAAKLEAINVHASLLPKYRGGAPVHYALINGDTETGVTIMKMVSKMDAGDIIEQQAIPITSQDDVGSMFERLSQIGTELLLATLPKIIAGTAVSREQDADLVSFSPNITREQEQIDWQQTSHQIDCQVRGMRPWPVAYTTYFGQRWKLWNVVSVDQTTDQFPGTITAISKESFQVACGQNTILQINQLQPAGKGKLSARDFLNGVGNKLEVGQRLE